MMNDIEHTARFHLPGLFEFQELYRLFLPLWRDRREWFHDWCDIASIYGAPSECLWGGGRIGFGDADAGEVFCMCREYGVSARLTFSNSLLTEEHLRDPECNRLARLAESAGSGVNGVIVASDALVSYLQARYPGLYLVSSTTKVIDDFPGLVRELRRGEFDYVVPDFRLNRDFDGFGGLPDALKGKVELLCNECCPPACVMRRACYDNVSRRALGQECPEYRCGNVGAGEGYSFSRAMENPCFIGAEDIERVYLPRGITNFKIEGRSLGSALVLEFLLYYLVKPRYQINVREAIYLDNALDLF